MHSCDAPVSSTCRRQTDSKRLSARRRGPGMPACTPLATPLPQHYYRLLTCVYTACTHKLNICCIKIVSAFRLFWVQLDDLTGQHKAYARRLNVCCITAVNALWVCRVQLDDLTGQHETYARQLRDRLLREQDLAVERERAAAQDRLREAAERYLLPPPCIQKRYQRNTVQRRFQKSTV